MIVDRPLIRRMTAYAGGLNFIVVPDRSTTFDSASSKQLRVES